MISYNCRACGAELLIEEGTRICTCQYCSSKQTLPVFNSDKKMNLYDRANHFRRNSDFDKAMEIYEQILLEDSEDAESYWNVVLCKYGVEYVKDPKTGNRVPTVNRTQYTSLLADEDYKAALRYASDEARELYEADAKAIEQIQKGILAISAKEAPFDVFICYKETDDAGHRTQDSVLANDIYELLTESGFKVFFSRITLESKLGQEFEPYIFAALNSAKAMIVLGTKPEYFQAPWVRNEWSRYLNLIKNGEKKILIPAYKGMDPYDLPDDFSHLQAQDMSRLGFVQDLKRSVEKIIEDSKPKKEVVRETIVIRQNGRIGNKTALLERGNMALEDEEFEDANSFFDDVLFQDPSCAEAYFGKMLASIKVSSKEAAISHFAPKLDTDHVKEVEVCPEKTEVIEKAVLDYTIPFYLEQREIREYFKYNRSFLSNYSTAVRQKELALQALEDNEFWASCVRYADDEYTKELNAFKDQITKDLDQVIESMESDNQEQINQIISGYEAFVETSLTKVKAAYDAAQQKRASDYEEGIKIFEIASSMDDVTKLIATFSRLSEYANAKYYLDECKKKKNELEVILLNERYQEISNMDKNMKVAVGVTCAIIFILIIIGISI